MLALLAFLAAPAFAEEGVEKVYDPDSTVPTSGGHGTKPTKENPLNEVHSEGEPKAKTSTETPKGKEGSEGESLTEEEPSEKEAGTHPATTGGDGGNKPSSGGGNPTSNGGESAKSSGKTEIGQSKPVATPPTQNVAHTDSGGGSSPVLWIVLAVAVLAAISIGTVILRQRRQDDGGSGSPVSPKAG